MSDHYILDKQHRTHVVTDVTAWAKSFEDRDTKIVQQNTVAGFLVSTVFLGVDHNHGTNGPPILFETMIFPPNDYGELYCYRYSTWEQAKRGHAAVRERLKRCRKGTGFAGKLETARRILDEFGASDQWEKVSTALWANKGHK